MAWIAGRWLRFAVPGLVAAVLALQGCAINPYPRIARPTDAELSAATAPGRPQPVRGSLDYEMLRADAFNAQYQRMLSDEFERQQKVSGTMIALGTAALAAAFFRAHSDVFLGLATGGVLTYQLGTWNSSENRLNIYLEGMKAVACLKSAAEPLRISPAQLEHFGRLAADTRTRADASALAAGRLASLLATTGSDDPLRPLATAELDDATERRARANDLLATEAGLANRVEGAGHVVERKLDDINRLVSAAVRGTLADLSALPQFIGEAAQYASIVVPGLKGGAALSNAVAGVNARLSPANAQAASPSALAASQALADAFGALRTAQAQLETSARALKGALDSTMALAQVRTAADGCGIDIGKQAASVAVERTELLFKPGEKVRQEVAISGGTRPYAARFQEVPAKGFRTADVPPGSSVVYIESDGEAAVGAVYHVRVSDSTLAGAQLTVRVVDPAAVAGTKAQVVATPAASVATCSGQEDLAREEVCLFQKLTLAPREMDGVFGPNSCAAFRKYTGTGLVNGTTKAALFKVANLASDKPTAAEIRAVLTPENLAACQLPATPASAAVPAATPAAPAASPASSLASSGSQCLPLAAGRQCTVPASGARCEFECRMTDTEIRNLRKKLKLNETPVGFDADLREKLAGFQQSRKLESKGSYNEDTARALGSTEAKP